MNISNFPVPYQELLVFQNTLDFHPEELQKLAPFQAIFTNKKKEFADYLHTVFSNLPETKGYLDYERQPGLLKNVWMNWFEFVFTTHLDKQFYAFQWHIGLRHGEINLDQGFVNLAFSVARQFCHKIIQSEIPSDSVSVVSEIVDKLLDLCLLVETRAYIIITFHCDRDVILGIADRIRNPVTVIGGNVRRLLRKTEPVTPPCEVYKTIMTEVKRLENIVNDTNAYINVSQHLPDITKNSLHELIQEALQRLQKEKNLTNANIQMDIKSEAQYVSGDRDDLEAIFYYLLQNSFEALPPEDPYISISASNLAPLNPNKIRIDIYNRTRFATSIQDTEKLFSPFYSSKSSGSGFGLPIVRAALKKNFGYIELIPIHASGIKISLLLPYIEEN